MSDPDLDRLAEELAEFAEPEKKKGRTPRDERIMEADCAENNQDIEHIVPGKFTQR